MKFVSGLVAADTRKTEVGEIGAIDVVDVMV